MNEPINETTRRGLLFLRSITRGVDGSRRAYKVVYRSGQVGAWHCIALHSKLGRGWYVQHRLLFACVFVVLKKVVFANSLGNLVSWLLFLTSFSIGGNSQVRGRDSGKCLAMGTVWDQEELLAG